MKVRRPFLKGGAELVTQAFGAVAAFEPVGYMGRDGGISYSVRKLVHEELGHYHNGVDYGLSCGTQLVAPFDGIVALAGLSPSGFGLRVVAFQGNWGWLLGHMSVISVHVGQKLSIGQTVGQSGGGMGDYRDGNSTGCHLHWSCIDQAYTYWHPARFLSGELGG